MNNPNPIGHSSIAVANRILQLAAANGETVSPLKLIKLVYLSHGFMLGLYGRPLVNEEAEAWTYGPVFRDLYRAVKKFGSNPVIGPLPDGDEDFDDLEEDVIAQVYEKYGHLSAISLSRLTHHPDSPWSSVWSEGRGHSLTISNDLLQEHYQQKLAS